MIFIWNISPASFGFSCVEITGLNLDSEIFDSIFNIQSVTWITKISFINQKKIMCEWFVD